MHTSNIAPSNQHSVQDPSLDLINTSLTVTKQDFKAMISGLDDPVGDQIFDEIWKALIAPNKHVTCDAQLQFNTSPLKIEKETLKADRRGLADSVDEQAFDGVWESLVERDHHESNRQNQKNINSASKKRKADSGNAGPGLDMERTSKKQKSAHSAVIDVVNDALLSHEAKKRVHRLPKISKRKRSTTNKPTTNKTISTTNPTVLPTPTSYNTTTPPTSKKRTHLPHLPNLTLIAALTSLKRLTTALTPYEYPYFTDAEIARDDALYAPLPVPEPQPTTFFGTEEERRLRELFPAF